MKKNYDSRTSEYDDAILSKWHSDDLWLRVYDVKDLKDEIKRRKEDGTLKRYKTATIIFIESKKRTHVSDINCIYDLMKEFESQESDEKVFKKLGDHVIDDAFCSEDSSRIYIVSSFRSRPFDVSNTVENMERITKIMSEQREDYPYRKEDEYVFNTRLILFCVDLPILIATVLIGKSIGLIGIEAIGAATLISNILINKYRSKNFKFIRSPYYKYVDTIDAAKKKEETSITAEKQLLGPATNTYEKEEEKKKELK